MNAEHDNVDSDNGGVDNGVITGGRCVAQRYHILIHDKKAAMRFQHSKVETFSSAKIFKTNHEITKFKKH